MSSLSKEKTTWIKSCKKPGPEKKKKKEIKDEESFHESKKKELTASYKDSRLDQPKMVLRQYGTPTTFHPSEFIEVRFVSNGQSIDCSCKFHGRLPPFFLLH